MTNVMTISWFPLSLMCCWLVWRLDRSHSSLLIIAHFFDKVFLTLCPVVHRTKEVATRELKCAELTAAHFKHKKLTHTTCGRKPVAVIVLLFTFPYFDKATATNNKK